MIDNPGELWISLQNRHTWVQIPSAPPSDAQTMPKAGRVSRRRLPERSRGHRRRGAGTSSRSSHGSSRHGGLLALGTLSPSTRNAASAVRKGARLHNAASIRTGDECLRPGRPTRGGKPFLSPTDFLLVDRTQRCARSSPTMALAARKVLYDKISSARGRHLIAVYLCAREGLAAQMAQDMLAPFFVSCSCSRRMRRAWTS